MTKIFYEITLLSEVKVEDVLDIIKQKYPNTKVIKKPGTLNKYIVDIGESNEHRCSAPNGFGND